MAGFMKDIAVPQVVLGCVLVAFFGGMSVTFLYAARHVSSVTDRDYYNHGLDYSKSSRQIAKGGTLGWRMTTRVRGDQLEVTVIDAKGSLVRGGKAHFVAQKSDGKVATTIPFIEPEPGVYRLALNPVPRGLTGQISFVTAEASMASRVVINP